MFGVYQLSWKNAKITVSLSNHFVTTHFSMSTGGKKERTNSKILQTFIHTWWLSVHQILWTDWRKENDLSRPESASSVSFCIVFLSNAIIEDISWWEMTIRDVSIGKMTPTLKSNIPDWYHNQWPVCPLWKFWVFLFKMTLNSEQDNYWEETWFSSPYYHHYLQV